MRRWYLGILPECPSASVRNERSAQPKIPKCRCRNDFRPQPAYRSVAYGIRVASTVVRIDRTDAATEVRLCVHSPNLRTADESLAIRKTLRLLRKYPFRSF